MKKILLSDDLNLFLEMEESLFRRHDVALLVAQSGTEALTLLEAELPSLVLLDLNLAEMSGDECCRRAKADPRLSDIPFVLMASASWEEEITRCRKAGCDEIIFKPVNRAHLLRTVRELLGIADRGARRAPAAMDVVYSTAPGESRSASCRDLSGGGLFLETDAALQKGTALRLLFHLPGRAKAVHCRGRVAWSNSPARPAKPDFPPGFGIQFTEISAGDHEAIEAFSAGGPPEQSGRPREG